METKPSAPSRVGSDSEPPGLEPQHISYKAWCTTGGSLEANPRLGSSTPARLDICEGSCSPNCDATRTHEGSWNQTVYLKCRIAISDFEETKFSTLV
jgi:hypothetical protein